MVNKLLDKIKYGATRSNKWPEVRKKHLGLYPTCAVCGSNKKVEVPFAIVTFSQLKVCEVKLGLPPPTLVMIKSALVPGRSSTISTELDPPLFTTVIV